MSLLSGPRPIRRQGPTAPTARTFILPTADAKRPVRHLHDFRGEATARWRAPDGRQQKGILTTATAPGISGATAGARIQVWLTGSGQPKAPPVGFTEATFSAVVMAIGALCAAALALLIGYWLGRLALDRRRMAKWASAWSLTSPRWTSRL
jgi:hypothetical protein